VGTTRASTFVVKYRVSPAPASLDAFRSALHHGRALTPGIDPTPESIGQRLRRLRLERNLSQRELSAPGVSYAYISRIEAGARRPSVKALRSLAAKLGVTPDYLETGSEIREAEARELRLADAELRLRLDGDSQADDLREILADAVAHADGAATARAQIALGLDAAARGDSAEAIRQLERVVDSGFVTPASRPDVYSTLGEAYALVGSPDRAADLFEHCLREIARLAPDDHPAHVRYSTYLSYALTDLGELQHARELVEESLRHAEEATDPYTRVRLHWSLGRISHEQSQPMVALEHFRRAVALLEATEDTFHLARAYLSCAAAALASGGDLDEVAVQIDRAERLMGPKPQPRDVAGIRRLRATHALRTGDLRAAERHARAAQAHAKDIPNQHALATWVLAEALAGRGEATAAEAFSSAAQGLEQHGTVREHVEVLRAYAHYLRDNGREREALELLDRAAEVASAARRETVRPRA